MAQQTGTLVAIPEDPRFDSQQHKLAHNHL